jgi:hypothetical protein
MTNGWIKLYRKIEEKNWWRKQRFTWGQAWIDLLLMANHKDEKVVFDNGNYFVPKGSFITSQRKLANKWKWGIARVSCFLSYLQKTEQCIEYKTEHNFTHIFILNWDKYQSEAEHQTEQKTEHERNMSGTRAETNKNVKNDKNINIYTTKFENFWKLYPSRKGIKVGKKKAKEQFLKKIKTEKDYNNLITAVKKYITTEQVQNEFAKDCFRWLRDEEWKDFLIEGEQEKEKKYIMTKKLNDKGFEIDVAVEVEEENQ